MKYMGSKRWMLQNGLGSLLSSVGQDANRFVDLFAGSGAVSIHISQKFSIPVLAYDLQEYSAALSGAIIERTSPFKIENIWKDWQRSAQKLFDKSKIPVYGNLRVVDVCNDRKWCANQDSLRLTKAYGGHYFSSTQAVWLDAFRFTVPTESPEKTVAIAALIHAASSCAAAPGHTAQPLQPARSSIGYIKAAWSHDMGDCIEKAFAELASTHAREKGQASVADANLAAESVREGDLVFIDPPYSGVHYSRFYHVFESIAHGNPGDVSGVGRYPDSEKRPFSRYSVKRGSKDALDDLFMKIAERKAKAILTFPRHACSNGLSGRAVKAKARRYFAVKEKQVESKFSTLGGTKVGKEIGNGRGARKKAYELILLLDPQ